ncbi:endonuclease domain-containing protein [Streptomyces sp. A5-4]|uniref:endonuclease domain-containing protein n=1 Tax=Streptomyces sp. A5-4 TaxID=3384771 RepID=UPI003DA95DBB
MHRLTCDEYEAMRDRAQERCEICNRPDRETPRGELVIDHFQGGGAWFVRGLLCDRCNSVMQRHDGTAPWGPASRPFAAKARAYHLNAFGAPSKETLQLADAAIHSRLERRAGLTRSI